MPAEDEYSEHYERVMREAFGERRIHIITERRPIRSVRDGDYVMYLPLEITEGANIDPQMARVISIQRNDRIFTLHTTLGQMYIKAGEAVQVVA